MRLLISHRTTSSTVKNCTTPRCLLYLHSSQILDRTRVSTSLLEQLNNDSCISGLHTCALDSLHQMSVQKSNSSDTNMRTVHGDPCYFDCPKYEKLIARRLNNIWRINVYAVISQRCKTTEKTTSDYIKQQNQEIRWS